MRPGVRSLNLSNAVVSIPASVTLTATGVSDPDGKVDRGSRDRFAMFLIGWLGGPFPRHDPNSQPRRLRHG